MLKKNKTNTSNVGGINLIYPNIYQKNTENIAPFYIRVSGMAQYAKNYEIIRVNADHIRLAYVISGSGYVEADEKLYEVQSGDSYMLLKGTAHHYFANPDDPWQMIWVNIYGDLGNMLAKAYNLHHEYVFHCDIHDNLSRIRELLRLDDEQQFEITNNTCLIFHEILQKFYNSIPKNTNISQDTQIMKNYIDKNIDTKISIDALGNLINRCPSQASRIFKKEMNITPYEYHLKNKMDKAVLLLETTDMPIKEIAFSLGFADEHYFSDIFKRKTYKKPSEYRKALK